MPVAVGIAEEGSILQTKVAMVARMGIVRPSPVVGSGGEVVCLAPLLQLAEPVWVNSGLCCEGC